MLKQPFSGKELFTEYEILMGRMRRPEISIEPKEDDSIWDSIGKTKKQAWNNLAKLINARMQMEAINE